MNTLFLLLNVITAAYAAPKPPFSSTVTRDELLKGCPIPMRRDYSLSKEVGPCDDFHTYVCSTVESNFKLPADRSTWTFSFADLGERLLYAKKQYFKKIESGYVPSNPRSRQYRDFYLACMNPKAGKADESFFSDLAKSDMVAIKDREEFLNLVSKNMEETKFSFVGFGTFANQKNPEVYDGVFESDIMTLPEKSYYENPEVMKDFKVLLVTFFKTIKMDQPEKRADWVISLETDFSKVYPVPADFRKRIYADNYMSREDYLKTYPHFKLDHMMTRIPEATQFRNLTPEAFAFLDKAFSELPLEQLKSYYLFKSIHPILDDSHPEYFQKRFAFNHKHLGGSEKRPDRQERCTKRIMGAFNKELDAELIDILFPQFPADKVRTLADSVRGTIVKGLEENKWLSSSGRKEAIAKIRDANLFLVKPTTDEQWYFNPLETYDAKKPIANAKRLDLALFNREVEELKQKRPRDRWSMGPLDLNAYYSGADNKFVLLQGILQYPFFDPDQSMIANLGAIGAVVGHELGHAIDDNGSKIDSSGRVRKWFTDQDLVEFKKRTSIFIDQFTKIGHNGELTLGENIGDHVGLTFAYQTAFPDPKKAKKEDLELFFESFGRLWCDVSLKKAEENRIKTNPHSLPRERINQQVIHQPGFYEAFGCHAGQKMYLPPESRVQVW